MKQNKKRKKYIYKNRRKRILKRRLLLFSLTIFVLFPLLLVLCAFHFPGLLGITKRTDHFTNEETADFQSSFEDAIRHGAENKHSSDFTDSDVARESSDWNLILVNPWNKLPDDYEVVLTNLRNNQSIDSRCYSYLQAMMADCRAAGCNPYICSSFRTEKKQKLLFREQTDLYLKQGYSKTESIQKAATSVAVPGTSEHQLGLAVDIIDFNHPQLDQSQEDTDVQKWLMKNSWRYGFILRYPTNKSDITGIIYEPWHYRFVGKAAAKEIYHRGITLEEYLEDM